MVDIRAAAFMVILEVRDGCVFMGIYLNVAGVNTWPIGRVY